MSKKMIAENEQIFSYFIESRDFYCVAEGKRTVFLKDTEDAGICIYGEISPRKKDFSNLSTTLLELAISMDMPDKKEEGIQLLKNFCKKIGDALVEHIDKIMPNSNALDRVAFGIESILHSMDAEFTCKLIKNGKRYELTRCPLCVAERESGIINETYIAHYAFNSICRDMAYKIDPYNVLTIFKSTTSDHEIILIGAKN